MSDTRHLRTRQLGVLIRYELRRTLLSRQSLLILILAGLPVVVSLVWALFAPAAAAAASTRFFAFVLHNLILRLVLFFTCAVLFIRLFRSEILDESLHYLLLAPAPRRVLTAGKYLGGVASSWALLIPTTLLCLLIAHSNRGPAALLHSLAAAGGLGHVAAVLALVALGCIAYGALFTVLGLAFRNPMVPAALVLGWESLVPLLPQKLKLATVMHHLNSLSPIPPRHRPLALLAEPTPAWLSVLLLLVASTLVLVLAAWLTRRLEVSYTTE